MRSKWARAAVFALVLGGLAPDAAAISFRVCGLSGCMEVSSAPDPGAGEFISTPPVAPYYEIRYPTGDRGFVVPSREAYKASLGISSGWSKIEANVMTTLAPALREVRPWPSPSLLEVLVGGQRAEDPQHYVRLYDEFPPVAPPRGAEKKFWIVLRSERATPWSVSIPVPFPKQSFPWVNGFNLLEYLPEHGVLNRNGEYVRLPTDLAELIETDAAVAEASNGFNTWWIVLAGAIVVAVGAGLAFARRSRP
jgi:hypothetical protein